MVFLTLAAETMPMHELERLPHAQEPIWSCIAVICVMKGEKLPKEI